MALQLAGEMSADKLYVAIAAKLFRPDIQLAVQPQLRLGDEERESL